MTTTKNAAGPRCMVCGATRQPGQLTDAIAHAPCDQRAKRFPHDHPDYTPGFWEAAGTAVIYDER
ncbi:hypothetical protein FHU38_003413 [Saccharomonospora amisosensis]|uniref:Uncharacterized protein n=1 Tax=Saccharomonospora amisosensis TaxID=1128677 RepID=A0A7X5URW2_9PSEU|nr:hypothetical protein [Saccharomonospora amisosensis]NIJ13069.1 hypothetical protein [Saccharomonospora amisosensis]